MSSFIKKHIYLLPVIVVMIAVATLSLHMHWQGDAIAFTYFMPAENEDFSSIRFNSVLEIWQSMCNHYMHSTGRFFSHSIAQFFCGFAGQQWFAICNSIAWGALILIILKLAKVDRRNSMMTLSASVLTFLLYYSYGGSEHRFPFEPPHQIDYVWMCALNGFYILQYFSDKKRDSAIMLTVLGILGFLAGQSNESFSIPIGGAIVTTAVMQRFRLTRRQWLMAILYGIGAIICIAAPGNFNRLGLTSEGWSLAHTMERMLPALIIPAIYVAIYFISKKKGYTTLAGQRGFVNFMIAAIVANYIVGIIVGMGSGTRIVTCANMFFIVMMLPRLNAMQSGKIIPVIEIGLLLAMIMMRYDAISVLNKKNIAIETQYHCSNDGIVVIPDDMFLYKAREFIFRPHTYMMKERALNPDKPDIHIRPESMQRLDLSRDSNMIVPIGRQAWLLIRSQQNPADFIIEKTLLPGIINRRMADRKIRWDDTMSGTVFDSTAHWKAAFYVNERPYITSKVVMNER